MFTLADSSKLAVLSLNKKMILFKKTLSSSLLPSNLYVFLPILIFSSSFFLVRRCFFKGFLAFLPASSRRCLTVLELMQTQASTKFFCKSKLVFLGSFLLFFKKDCVIFQVSVTLSTAFTFASCSNRVCSSSSFEGHPLQVRHKQGCGRGFILLLPKTAALPESDAGSGVIKPASSFIIQNRQTWCSMWCPMYRARY